MSIDLKRLTKDCANAQATLAANGHALRRTGATAIIEPVLPLIRELRARKHSWAAIAAALAKQGVVQGVDHLSMCMAAVSRDLLRHRFHVRFSSAGQKDFRTFGREFLGDCGANRTSSTENDGMLSLQDCRASHGCSSIDA